MPRCASVLPSETKTRRNSLSFEGLLCLCPCSCVMPNMVKMYFLVEFRSVFDLNVLIIVTSYLVVNF